MFTVYMIRLCSVVIEVFSFTLSGLSRWGRGEGTGGRSEGLWLGGGSLAVRQNYAAAIMRFVAGACDRMRGSSRLSVVDLAGAMGIPRLVIDVRHGAPPDYTVVCTRR